MLTGITALLPGWLWWALFRASRLSDRMAYSRQLGHRDSRKLERNYRFWKEALKLDSYIPSYWKALRLTKVVTPI